MKRFQFNIPRNNIHFKHPHSRYVWGDPIYKSLMIQIMENLEPYQFMKDEILVKEVEVVSCLYFIQTSQFAVGYTVNGESLFRLRQNRSVVGIYEATFNQSSSYIYKVLKQSDGFFLRVRDRSHEHEQSNCWDFRNNINSSQSIRRQKRKRV